MGLISRVSSRTYRYMKMSSKDLKWVQSNLYNACGLSDTILAEFFIENAKASRSSNELISKIQNSGMADIDKSMTEFCNKMYDRFGKEAKKEKQSQLLIDTLAMKSKTYNLVESSDEEDQGMEINRDSSHFVDVNNKKSKKAKKSSKRLRNLRKRRMDDENEEDVRNYPKKFYGGSSSSSEEYESAKPNKKSVNFIDPEDELAADEARERLDQEERDAFARRILEKDKARTRNKITENVDAKNISEPNKPTEQEFYDLRIKSRQDYLKKREQQKIEELEQEIKDNEYLFKGQTLTKREKKDQKRRKEILAYSKAYKNLVEKESNDRYFIPDEKQGQLQDKYVEIQETGDTLDADTGKLQKLTDQQKWESLHLRRTNFKLGAQDQKNINKQKEYDFLIEDTFIDFQQV